MITQSRQTPCLVCCGVDYELISRRDRDGYPLDTLACRECGLVRHQDIPSEAALEEYYATHYREAYHGETMPSPRRVMRAWSSGRRIANQLSPYLQLPSRTLEIGAGLGCAVKALEELGCHAEGIEPHHGFQAYAVQSVRARVRPLYLKELEEGPLYDLVLMIHVIEHLRQPHADIRRLRQFLAPGGLLYLECPNLAAPFARKSRMFHYAHLYNFTPDTLRSLVEQCGFRMVQVFSSSANSTNDDPNLQMLFQRDAPRRYQPFDGYRKMRGAIDRLNAVSYFCRVNYLARYTKKVANMALETLTARAQVRRLEQRWAA